MIARDPGGLLFTYWEGRGFAVNPVATAGRWQGLNEALTPEALADALIPSAWGGAAVRGASCCGSTTTYPTSPG